MIQQTLQNSIRFIPWRARTAVKRIPLVASFQRKLLAHALEGNEFVHTIDAGPAQGLKYPVLLPEDKGVWTGTYEIDFVDALARSVEKGATCFDVGGWRGYCGGTMAAQGASRVVIFEPLPGNCERIQRMIDLNPDYPIELVNAAAGESNGTATFEVMDATSMGKLADSPFQQDVSGSENLTVDVVALDAWCDAHNATPPSVMKIDVEGAEMMVLRGAKKLLHESYPALFVEAHSRELTREVSEFLRKIGYDVRTLETGNAPDGTSEPEVCHIVACRTAR